MTQFLKSVVACLVVLAGISAAFAQPVAEPPKDSPEVAVVRAAAKEFGTALGEEDIGKAKALFAGTPEDFKVAEAMHKTMRLMAKFKAAAIKAFPEMADKPMSDDLTHAGLMKRVNNDEIKVDGDTAAFSRSGFRLKKIDGAWKAVAVVGANDKSTLAVMTAFGQAVEQTLPELEAGKFTSPKAVDQAFKPRFQAAMQKAMEASKPKGN